MNPVPANEPTYPSMGREIMSQSWLNFFQKVWSILSGFEKSDIKGDKIDNYSNQTVETASRTVDTVYQNTTGKPLFISASISVGTSSIAYAYTDSESVPTVEVARVENVSASLSATLSLCFVVLPENYYKVTGSSVVTWTEWY